MSSEARGILQPVLCVRAHYTMLYVGSSQPTHARELLSRRKKSYIKRAPLFEMNLEMVYVYYYYYSRRFSISIHNRLVCAPASQPANRKPCVLFRSVLGRVCAECVVYGIESIYNMYSEHSHSLQIVWKLIKSHSTHPLAMAPSCAYTLDGWKSFATKRKLGIYFSSEMS